jgi:LPS sulfotransferase NodH
MLSSRFAARNAKDKLARLRRDARVYAASAFVSERGIRRFSVVCNSRTGSTLLCDLLNSHPRIECDDEILATWHDYPFLYVCGSAGRARRRGFDAYGFKFNTMALKLPPTSDDVVGRFIENLASSGFMFIRLRRKNTVRQALSVLRAAETVYHQRGPQGGVASAIEVDVGRLLQVLSNLERHDDGLDVILAPFGAHEFTYEGDLEDSDAQQSTVDRIGALLGVDAASVRTELRKFAPPRLEDAIMNFDEVARHLSSTKFEQFLYD